MDPKIAFSIAGALVVAVIGVMIGVQIDDGRRLGAIEARLAVLEFMVEDSRRQPPTPYGDDP